MSGIDTFLGKIPDERLLICGEAGEYWTDRARFSTAKPKLISPVYDIEEIKSVLTKIDSGSFSGIYIAWGLSRLLEEREIAEKLLELVDGGGVLLSIELLDTEDISPAQVNHANYLRLMYGSDFLPKNRILSVLKSMGMTQIRSMDFYNYESFLRVKDFSAIYGYAIAALKVMKSERAKNLLNEINRHGFEPAPAMIIAAEKRKTQKKGRAVVSPSMQKAAREMYSAESLHRKMMEFGLEAMKDQELLAIALDCDEAAALKIIRQFGGKALLKDKEIDKLASELGLDDMRALKLMAILETGRRFFTADKTGPAISSPEEAAGILSDMRDLKREHLRGLYLDLRGRLIWDEIIALGKLNRALVEPREILAPGIEHGATGLIIAHNHPSGNTAPSSDDSEMTELIESAAELMKIDLWDHIIIAKEGFYSFNQAGKIKKKKRYG